MLWHIYPHNQFKKVNPWLKEQRVKVERSMCLDWCVVNSLNVTLIILLFATLDFFFFFSIKQMINKIKYSFHLFFLNKIVTYYEAMDFLTGENHVLG